MPAYNADQYSRNQIDYAQNQIGQANQRGAGQIDYQRNRFEQQQNPIINEFAQNYGRGTEQGFGDYGDIMNRYRQIYDTAGTPDDGGGGGGGGGYGMVDPYLINVKDPFNSYAGYQDFSTTGGYSPDDIANMRARGVSPIRAAYANAQRGISRQRALQGGYGPNATAAMVRMAREQGQSGADATQNVEAGLAQMRNQGRLAGLGGMSDIEKQRYEMDYKQQVYNAQAQASAASQNASAAGANSAASRAAADQNVNNQFRALGGMADMYGATPGMANTFGNQVLGALNSGGQFGSNVMNAENQYGQNVNQGQNTLIQGRNVAGQMPGQFDTTVNRIGQIGNIVGAAGNMIAPFLNRNPQSGGTTQPLRPTTNFGTATTGNPNTNYRPIQPYPTYTQNRP